MAATAEADGYEIYNIESLDELNQTIASIGPSLTLLSHTENCHQFLKKNKKFISQFRSKVILVTQASVSAIDIEKMRKLGLSENMYEPINQKTLLYKVKMLIKALPNAKAPEEEEEEVKTFSSTKDESSLNTNEKLRLEKGISDEEGLEFDSSEIEEEKKLFSLDEIRKKKKKESSLQLEGSSKHKEETQLDIEEKGKKSRLGSLLKSLGSIGKKKSKDDALEIQEGEARKESPLSLDLDAGDEVEIADRLRKDLKTKKELSGDLELQKGALKKRSNMDSQELGEYNKKKLAKDLTLDANMYKKNQASFDVEEEDEENDDPFAISVADVERMKKQGISLDIPPNLPKDRLEILLTKDPILRKKVLDFKLAEKTKKRRSSIKMVDEVKDKKKGSVVKFDLGFVRKNKKEDATSIREKILEEKRRLLEKKLEEERILSAIEEETTKAKEPEPEIIYEPNSKSMERIIDLLTVYQDKKMDRLEIFKKASQTIFELKHGLVAFLSYLEDKKEFEDLFISHNQEFNTDKEERGEEYWKTIRNEKLKTWMGVKLPTWSDEWFSGNAKDAEFIYPVTEGKSLLGLIVVHFVFKENEQLSEADAKKIEVFIESTRGVYLERFKGAKDKGDKSDDGFAGDGTSYSKIFKDFFEKIFKKAG